MADGPGSSPASASTAGKAVGALVCGIIGLLVCAPVGIAAIILGSQARTEIAGSGGRLQGDGMAHAGWILGWIAVGLLVFGILVFFVVVLAAAAGTA
jgi:Domain of unknown function (DUF4190)